MTGDGDALDRKSITGNWRRPYIVEEQEAAARYRIRGKRKYKSSSFAKYRAAIPTTAGDRRVGKELVGGNRFLASRAASETVKDSRAKHDEVALCKKESGGKHHKDSLHSF
jgi:hypothetical protein